MSYWGKSTYRTELTYIDTDVLRTRQNALTAAQCMSPGSIVSTGMSQSYSFNHATVMYVTKLCFRMQRFSG